MTTIVSFVPEGDTRRGRFYVQYTVDAHGNRVVEDVMLPGDLLSVKDKMTANDLAKVQKLIDRRRY